MKRSIFQNRTKTKTTKRYRFRERMLFQISRIWIFRIFIKIVNTCILHSDTCIFYFDTRIFHFDIRISSLKFYDYISLFVHNVEIFVKLTTSFRTFLTFVASVTIFWNWILNCIVINELSTSIERFVVIRRTFHQYRNHIMFRNFEFWSNWSHAKNKQTTKKRLTNDKQIFNKKIHFVWRNRILIENER